MNTLRPHLYIQDVFLWLTLLVFQVLTSSIWIQLCHTQVHCLRSSKNTIAIVIYMLSESKSLCKWITRALKLVPLCRFNRVPALSKKYCETETLLHLEFYCLYIFQIVNVCRFLPSFQDFVAFLTLLCD